MMLLKGTTNQTSFARYAGLLIVLTLILVTFAQLYAFLFMEICNPIIEGGKLIIHDDKIIKICERRLDTGAQAAWATAIGMTLGGTAGWFYRETKKAEVANGEGH